MQQARLTQSGFVLEQAEIPQPGSDEVLVRTSACGVCGGDIHLYGERSSMDSAMLLGHEGGGVVVEVGSAVSGFAPGDRVTALGGAYADYFVASAEDLVRIPAEIDASVALGEPIACCVHAGDRFATKKGDRVAVVGCGFMGLICLQLAKLQGAGEILAIDPVPYRREMAERLGATASLAPADVVIEDTSEGAFDLVVEAAGGQSAVDLCSDLVAHHGRIVLIGYHQSNNGQRSVNMQLWNYKAIDVINGHVRRDDEKREAMAKGIRLLEAGDLIVEPLVSLYALENVREAFNDFESQKDGLFKAVLIPGSDG